MTDSQTAQVITALEHAVSLALAAGFDPDEVLDTVAAMLPRRDAT